MAMHSMYKCPEVGKHSASFKNQELEYHGCREEEMRSKIHAGASSWRSDYSHGKEVDFTLTQGGIAEIF